MRLDKTKRKLLIEKRNRTLEKIIEEFRKITEKMLGNYG